MNSHCKRISNVSNAGPLSFNSFVIIIQFGIIKEMYEMGRYFMTKQAYKLDFRGSLLGDEENMC